MLTSSRRQIVSPGAPSARAPSVSGLGVGGGVTLDSSALSSLGPLGLASLDRLIGDGLVGIAAQHTRGLVPADGDGNARPAIVKLTVDRELYSLVAILKSLASVAPLAEPNCAWRITVIHIPIDDIPRSEVSTGANSFSCA